MVARLLYVTLRNAGVALVILSSAALGFAQPFTFTQSAGPVTTTNAVLHGMVVPNGLPTVAWFEWGADSSFGQSSIPVDLGAGNAVVRVDAMITNLSPTCYFRVVGNNALGLTYGQTQLFTRVARPIAWGYNGNDQTNAPTGINAVAITAGGAHALAVDMDGRVIGWGQNTDRQRTVPTDLPGVICVAAGIAHSLALTTNGTVIGWGRNTAGQTNVPTGLSNVVAIAAGEFHSLALKADGLVVVWGQNSSGQTNVPLNLSNVVAIASGDSHNLALKCDGTVVAWGLNSNGQTNVPTGLTNVIAIAGGRYHSLALKADGKVVAWGLNTSGQTNVPSTLSNVVSIAAGSLHSLALTADGTLATWGLNNYKQSTVPAGVGRVFAIDGGTDFSLVLRNPEARPFAHTRIPAPITATTATLNGVVTPNGLPTFAWFEWGPDAGFSQLTATTAVTDGLDLVHLNVPINGLLANEVYRCRLVASNSAGVTYGVIQRFTTGRKVVSWGSAAGVGLVTPPLGLSNVVSLVAGDYHGLALSADGTLTIWGSWGSFGSSTLKPYVPADLIGVVAIAGGRDHDVALKADGTIVAWGGNSSGQTNVPVGLTNVVAISAGDQHTMALKKDGTVVVWGYFGSFNGTPASVPAGLNNVVAISSGDTQCMALRDDGSVVLWSGSTFTSGPANATNVVAIEADYQHDVALRADGTVVDWGIGAAPSGLSNVISIASGDYHTMALRADGSLTIWAYYPSLTNVPAGLTGIVGIASGDEFQMALAANTPPQAVPRTFNGPANRDWIVNLTGTSLPVATDPNGDPLTCRVVSLPTAGSLYQYSAGGRGEAITVTNTPVADPSNRLIFVPVTDEFGVPYSSFSIVANDGDFDSPASLVTLGVIPSPIMTLTGLNQGPDGNATLNFSGLSNVAYSVWASTNLVNWSSLGAASQPTPGQFIYNDTSTTSWPQRFYRIRSP